MSDDEAIREYAAWIGISLPEEEHLLWIAEQGWSAALPPGWEEVVVVDEHTNEEYAKFRQTETGIVQDTHPLDDHYRDLVERHRTGHVAGETSELTMDKNVASGGSAVALTVTRDAVNAAPASASRPTDSRNEPLTMKVGAGNEEVPQAQAAVTPQAVATKVSNNSNAPKDSSNLLKDNSSSSNKNIPKPPATVPSEIELPMGSRSCEKTLFTTVLPESLRHIFDPYVVPQRMTQNSTMYDRLTGQVATVAGLRRFQGKDVLYMKLEGHNGATPFVTDEMFTFRWICIDKDPPLAPGTVFDVPAVAAEKLLTTPLAGPIMVDVSQLPCAGLRVGHLVQSPGLDGIYRVLGFLPSAVRTDQSCLACSLTTSDLSKDEEVARFEAGDELLVVGSPSPAMALSPETGATEEISNSHSVKYTPHSCTWTESEQYTFDRQYPISKSRSVLLCGDAEANMKLFRVKPGDVLDGHCIVLGFARCEVDPEKSTRSGTAEYSLTLWVIEEDGTRAAELKSGVCVSVGNVPTKPRPWVLPIRQSLLWAPPTGRRVEYTIPRQGRRLSDLAFDSTCLDAEQTPQFISTSMNHIRVPDGCPTLRQGHRFRCRKHNAFCTLVGVDCDGEMHFLYDSGYYTSIRTAGTTLWWYPDDIVVVDLPLLGFGGIYAKPRSVSEVEYCQTASYRMAEHRIFPIDDDPKRLEKAFAVVPGQRFNGWRTAVGMTCREDGKCYLMIQVDGVPHGHLVDEDAVLQLEAGKTDGRRFPLQGAEFTYIAPPEDPAVPFKMTKVYPFAVDPSRSIPVDDDPEHLRHYYHYIPHAGVRFNDRVTILGMFCRDGMMDLIGHVDGTQGGNFFTQGQPWFVDATSTEILLPACASVTADRFIDSTAAKPLTSPSTSPDTIGSDPSSVLPAAWDVNHPLNPRLAFLVEWGPAASRRRSVVFVDPQDEVVGHYFGSSWRSGRLCQSEVLDTKVRIAGVACFERKVFLVIVPQGSSVGVLCEEDRLAPLDSTNCAVPRPCSVIGAFPYAPDSLMEEDSELLQLPLAFEQSFDKQPSPSAEAMAPPVEQQLSFSGPLIGTLEQYDTVALKGYGLYTFHRCLLQDQSRLATYLGVARKDVDSEWSPFFLLDGDAAPISVPWGSAVRVVHSVDFAPLPQVDEDTTRAWWCHIQENEPWPAHLPNPVRFAPRSIPTDVQLNLTTPFYPSSTGDERRYDNSDATCRALFGVGVGTLFLPGWMLLGVGKCGTDVALVLNYGCGVVDYYTSTEPLFLARLDEEIEDRFKGAMKELSSLTAMHNLHQLKKGRPIVYYEPPARSSIGSRRDSSSKQFPIFSGKETRAIGFVGSNATEKEIVAKQVVTKRLESSKQFPDAERTLDSILAFVNYETPLISWFKPLKLISRRKDAPTETIPVIEAMTNDIELRNLFETGDGNANEDLDARAHWEKLMFGDAYHSAEPNERVKYGVANVFNDPNGADACSGQYGDCFLVFRDVRGSITMTPDDSSHRPSVCLPYVGFTTILAEFEEKKPELEALAMIATGQSNCQVTADLTYKEIQIHGHVYLEQHISHVVIHPKYKQRPMDLRLLLQFCRKNACWLITTETLHKLVPLRCASINKLESVIAENGVQCDVSPCSHFSVLGTTKLVCGPQTSAQRDLYDKIVLHWCMKDMRELERLAEQDTSGGHPADFLPMWSSSRMAHEQFKAKREKKMKKKGDSDEDSPTKPDRSLDALKAALEEVERKKHAKAAATAAALGGGAEEALFLASQLSELSEEGKSRLVFDAADALEKGVISQDRYDFIMQLLF